MFKFVQESTILKDSEYEDLQNDQGIISGVSKHTRLDSELVSDQEEDINVEQVAVKGSRLRRSKSMTLLKKTKSNAFENDDGDIDCDDDDDLVLSDVDDPILIPTRKRG
jgi:hypothetical protein